MMGVIGWAMLVLPFAGMAWLMREDVPAVVVLKTFVAALAVTGWIWLAVNLVCGKG